MLSLSEILNAQNGFAPQKEGQQNQSGNILGSFQNGFDLGEALKKAGLFGAGSAEGAVGTSAIPAVPVG